MITLMKDKPKRTKNQKPQPDQKIKGERKGESLRGTRQKMIDGSFATYASEGVPERAIRNPRMRRCAECGRSTQGYSEASLILDDASPVEPPVCSSCRAHNQAVAALGVQTEMGVFLGTTMRTSGDTESERDSRASIMRERAKMTASDARSFGLNRMREF